MKAALPYGDDEEGIPGTGVLEISGGEVGVAIGMRVEDGQNVEALGARITLGTKKISGANLVAVFLRAVVDIIEREGLGGRLDAVGLRAEKHTAALAWIRGFGMGDEELPGFGLNLEHADYWGMGRFIER